MLLAVDGVGATDASWEIGETMKAVQVVARGEARFVEVETPSPQPGHVLVRCGYLSLCGSDIQMLHHAAESSYPFPPGTTGHEMVGTVIATGETRNDLKPGDRVLALAPGHRAMSEVFLAKNEHVVLLPNDMPLEELLQAQQLGTVIFASQHLPCIVGKTVAVIGQGSAGLWFNFHLRRMGARRVIALDLETHRLRLSNHYGATSTINNAQLDAEQQIRELNEGELADLVVEAAGEVDSINLAVQLVKKWGNILYFGYPRQQSFRYDFSELFHKCCSATTVVGASVEPGQVSTQIAVDLIYRGVADPKPMMSHRFAFKDVLDAYELHRTRGDGAVKIVIEMPGAE